MRPYVRITANGDFQEVLSERVLFDGLLEVELRSSKHENVYRAIVSQIQTPSPSMCAYLIEHLPNVGEFEELEVLDMAYAIRRGDKKTYDTNAIVSVIPYLVRAGLLSYERRRINSVQACFFYKRAATADVIRRTLSDTPSIEQLERDRKKKKKKKKKKTPALVADASPLPTKKKKKKRKASDDQDINKKKRKKKKPLSSAPDEGKTKKKKKKKRKKCCDDPRIVRSKKTGKRRCKNCGTKLPPKKKKKTHA